MQYLATEIHLAQRVGASRSSRAALASGSHRCFVSIPGGASDHFSCGVSARKRMRVHPAHIWKPIQYKTFVVRKFRVQGHCHIIHIRSQKPVYVPSAVSKTFFRVIITRAASILFLDWSVPTVWFFAVFKGVFKPGAMHPITAALLKAGVCFCLFGRCREFRPTAWRFFVDASMVPND